MEKDERNYFDHSLVEIHNTAVHLELSVCSVLRCLVAVHKSQGFDFVVTAPIDKVLSCFSSERVKNNRKINLFEMFLNLSYSQVRSIFGLSIYINDSLSISLIVWLSQIIR